MSESANAVLDACAVIAYLNDEEGAQKIDDLLAESRPLLMAGINALEVAYDAVKTTGEPSAAAEAIRLIEKMPCHIKWTLTQAVLVLAAQFKAVNRISLADSVALGLTKSLNAKLVTSDHHEFDILDKREEVAFFWIR